MISITLGNGQKNNILYRLVQRIIRELQSRVLSDRLSGP